MFGLWVWIELRHDVLLVDLCLMARRGVWKANFVAIVIGIAIYGSIGFVPQLMQTPPESGCGFGSTVTQASHVLLPNAIFIPGGLWSPGGSERGRWWYWADR